MKPILIFTLVLPALAILSCGDSSSKSSGTPEVTFHAPLNATQAAIATRIESGGQPLDADFEVDGAAITGGIRGGVKGGIRGGIRGAPGRAEGASRDFAWEVTFPVPKETSVPSGEHQAAIVVYPEGRSDIKLLSAGATTSLAISGGQADLSGADISSIELFTEPGRKVPNIINLAAGVDPKSSAPDATDDMIAAALEKGTAALASVPDSDKK